MAEFNEHLKATFLGQAHVSENQTVFNYMLRQLPNLYVEDLLRSALFAATCYCTANLAAVPHLYASS